MNEIIKEAIVAKGPGVVFLSIDTKVITPSYLDQFMGSFSDLFIDLRSQHNITLVPLMNGIEVMKFEGEPDVD